MFKLFKIKKISDLRGYSQIFEYSHHFKNKFNRIYFSINKKKGTIRGLHFQKKYQQNKLLIVQEGSIFDVLVDVNKKSKTFKKVYSFKLGNKKKFNCIYIPKNFAHGFQSLENNTKLIYLIDQKFERNNELIKYNDSELKIKWPVNKITISKKDNPK
jgi:dTDP-4-dehydrorhamnose 3,5-epimerase